jgi:Mg-chelatase subunit ChlD
VPPPEDLFLPLALREVPCTRQQRADVVLVIDASSSMREPAGDGRTKLEAARAGAAAFVEGLQLEAGDRAAIVQFDHAATILAGLTEDRAVLLAALDAIAIAAETCLVCGLEAAEEALDGAEHRPESQPTIILMTDGRSNPRPVSEAVAEAARMKARGIDIFTIGLGEDLDEAALVEIASRPAYAFRAADGAALEAIYRELAVTLPGPVDCYWGRRR